MLSNSRRFVDCDMGMRYRGGGVGHFAPTPPQDNCPPETEPESGFDTDEPTESSIHEIFVNKEPGENYGDREAESEDDDEESGIDEYGEDELEEAVDI